VVRKDVSHLCRLLIQRTGDSYFWTSLQTTLDAETVFWLRKTSYKIIRVQLLPSPTTVTSLITLLVGFLNLIEVQGIPWEGNYSSWLEQKQKRLAQVAKTQNGF
jgi:sulfate-transporting ATPase